MKTFIKLLHQIISSIIGVSGAGKVIEPVIFGIDIFPHYSKVGSGFNCTSYALVIGEGKSIVKRIRVSRMHLLRLIHNSKPSIVAVDNVFELAPDIEGLKNVFSMLPPETKVIQVTGTPKEAISLQDAAVKYGFTPPSRISPMEEAEMCVKLACLNVGSEVKLLGDETKILVSRDISLGPGGSSQARFRRKTHTSILTATRNIERALKREGLDYDLSVEEADFGLERADFTVYAPRTRLQGVIYPGHGHYIQVKVKPTYRDRVEFVNLSQSQSPFTYDSSAKRLIVGIDPGTTCGIAVITLDGAPVYLDSSKNLSRGEILRLLTDLGRPLIVAADVVNVPLFVKKLAKDLDSIIFTPETLLTAVEKQEIAQTFAGKYNLVVRDSHSRAAFAAAIKAYQHYRNKFEQVEVEAKKTGLQISVDEVKALVVKGQSIQRALTQLSPPQLPELKEEPPEKTETLPEDVRFGSLQKTISFYREQTKQLKEINEQLSKKVEMLESQITTLRGTINSERGVEMQEIRRNREYQLLKREVEQLRNQLLRVQQKAEESPKTPQTISNELTHSSELIFLKPIEAFTKEGLEETIKLYNIERGDVPIMLDASCGGASTSKKIVERGVRAVVACTPMSHQAVEAFEECDIPIISSNKLKIDWVDGRPYIKRTDLETALSDAKAQHKNYVATTIRGIVDEYREERRHEVKKALPSAQ